MGLSIHYSGKIRDIHLIQPLIEEVQKICEVAEWKNRIADNAEIRGIIFSPEGSESIDLTFTPSGRLLSPKNIIVKEIFDDKQVAKNLFFTASTKTQFAGMQAHKAIIHLLKYLSEKYFSEFTLIDEGNYWETGDEKILIKQFSQYNAALDFFENSLKTFKSIPDEPKESLVKRLEIFLNEQMRKKKND